MSRDKIDDLSLSLTFVTLYSVSDGICWKRVFSVELKNLSLLVSFIDGSQCTKMELDMQVMWVWVWVWVGVWVCVWV